MPWKAEDFGFRIFDLVSARFRPACSAAMSLRPFTLALLVGSHAMGEPRPWTNAQGKQVQAMFVKNEFSL